MTTIVFRHGKHPQLEALTAIVRQFEAEHPGIRVREELLPATSDDQHQYYVINLGAGAEDTDVLDMDIIWAPEFARAGWLTPLGDQVTAAELAPLHGPAREADRLNGEVYAVPWFLDTGVLYYRRDLLEKYGFSPPRTYPALARQARAILDGEQDPRLLGFIWQGLQYEGLVCVALEFIRGNGGSVLRGTDSPAPGEPAALQALDFMQRLVATGITPPSVTTLTEEPTRQLFQSGRAIFMRNWPYAWSLVNAPDSPVAGRVGLMPVPSFDGHPSVPTLGGYHLGVSAFSRHKDAALTFVRFMTRYESQKRMLLTMGLLPAHMEVYEDPEVRTARPFLGQLLPAIRLARPRPVSPYYLMISQALQPEFSAIVAGIREPEEAMRLAAQQMARTLTVE